jgi:rhomboid protease GluP
MQEKNIKIIIKGFTELYGYLLEDIRSKDSQSELWTVSKDISGVHYRVIFLTEHSLHQLIHYDIPEDKNNIYILFSEDELSGDKEAKALRQKEDLSINNLLEKPLIRVEVKERKVNYSENVNLQVVQELASVMSNNNLQSHKEKVNLKDRPWITMGIIAINVILYVVTAYLSYFYAQGSIFDSDTTVLIYLGAKVNELIAEGQYFRLISCMFLHGGILHLAVNMYSLFAIGPMVEKVYGKTKYITIYFVAGICSSIFSYKFSTGVSIGASGAIFGLLGAVLVFAIKSKGKTGNAFIKNILSVIFVNILIGMTLPNIDNFAHVGGLLGGMAISFLVTLRSEV